MPPESKRRSLIKGVNAVGGILLGLLFLISISLFVTLCGEVYLLRLVAYCLVPVAFIGGFFLAVPLERYDSDTTRFGFILCMAAIVFGLFLNAASIYEHESNGRDPNQLFNGDYPITRFFSRGDANPDQYNPIYRYWPGMYQDGGGFTTNDVTIVRMAQGVNLNSNDHTTGYGDLVLLHWNVRVWTDSVFLVLQVVALILISIMISNDEAFFGRNDPTSILQFLETTGAVMSKYCAWIATGIYTALAVMAAWAYVMGYPHENQFDFYHILPAFAVGMFFRPPVGEAEGNDVGPKFIVGTITSLFSTIVLLILLVHLHLDLDHKGPGLFGDYKSLFNNGTKYLHIYRGDTNEARYFDDVFVYDTSGLGGCFEAGAIVGTCDAYHGPSGVGNDDYYIRVTSKLIKNYFNNVTYAYDAVADDLFINRVSGMMLFDHVCTLILFFLVFLISLGAVLHWVDTKKKQKERVQDNEYYTYKPEPNAEIPVAEKAPNIPVAEKAPNIIGIRMRSTPSISQQRIVSNV